MKKLRLAAAAAIAGAITLTSAGSAHAYPDPSVVIDISDSVLYGGDTFTFKATASVDCEWTVNYPDGVAPGVSPTQTGSGTSLTGSYKTKVVSETFKSPITAICVYDDGTSVTSASTQTASASATVTLLPRGADDDSDGDGDGDDSGALPDTGGSNLTLLIVGGALVVAGGGAVYAARRRQTAH